jgi:hypothetical protein
MKIGMSHAHKNDTRLIKPHTLTKLEHRPKKLEEQTWGSKKRTQTPKEMSVMEHKKVGKNLLVMKLAVKHHFEGEWE